MLSIGLVDLDTSHARSFAKILNSISDVKMTAIFDGGCVRNDDEIKEFCKDFDVQHFSTVEELAQDVDAAMVLSVDWQVHLERMRPLLLAGKPVYIDKPLAGSVKYLDEFVSLVEQANTPVLAGSGWRFNDPIQKAHQQLEKQQVDHIFAMIGNDYFYYGIHLVEMALGLLGPGIETVQMLVKEQDAHVLSFSHQRGAAGHLFCQGPRPQWDIWFTANNKPQHVNFSPHDLHAGVCHTFVDMVRTEKSPLSAKELTESTRVMLAGLQSHEEQREVKIKDLSPDMFYDSREFMLSYH